MAVSWNCPEHPDKQTPTKYQQQSEHALLTRLTSDPFLITLKHELMICHVALYVWPLPIPLPPAPALSPAAVPASLRSLLSLLDGVPELSVAILRGAPNRLLSLVGVTGALVADAFSLAVRSLRSQR